MIPTVLTISGGRTSGLMLRRELDKGNKPMLAYANTGKELDETIDFLHRMETEWGVEIVWLEYTRVRASKIDPSVFPTPKRQQNHQKLIEANGFTHWFKRVDYQTAARNNRGPGPFDDLLSWAETLPNPVARACSYELKFRTIERWLFSEGLTEWRTQIGIRHDERDRCTNILAYSPKYNRPVFPLVEDKITEADVMEFWSKQPFDLGIQSYEGNCDLCFLKKKSKRVRLVKERPETVKWWKYWERVFAENGSGAGNVFRKGEPYSEIEAIAKDSIPLLVESREEEIACSCAEKGLADEESEQHQLL